MLPETAHAAVTPPNPVNLGTIAVKDSANWGVTLTPPVTADILNITFTPGPNGTGGDMTSVSSRFASAAEIDQITVELFDGSTSIAGPQLLSNGGSATNDSFPSFVFSHLVVPVSFSF
jgi:hypothetical protein